eukprot:6938277-Prymnesium_polylepis.1
MLSLFRAPLSSRKSSRLTTWWRILRPESSVQSTEQCASQRSRVRRVALTTLRAAEPAAEKMGSRP